MDHDWRCEDAFSEHGDLPLPCLPDMDCFFWSILLGQALLITWKSKNMNSSFCCFNNKHAPKIGDSAAVTQEFYPTWPLKALAQGFEASKNIIIGNTAALSSGKLPWRFFFFRHGRQRKEPTVWRKPPSRFWDHDFLTGIQSFLIGANSRVC